MNLRAITTALLFTVFFGFANAQQAPISTTPAAQRIAAFVQRKALQEQSLVAGVPFASIGPTVFSGRVTDIAVSPTDPTTFFVAYASGGLWKTTNNGHSFTPLLDNEMVMTIGDIAVNWEQNLIWVGTGEVNSSRSSYSGTGVFVSRDGGQTWEHKGLGESHHIGSILLHPGDPNTAWVAALGHLYSPNPERGVFKTTDGGRTWQHVLFVDANTGAVDLAADPNDPNTIYAALWHRERRAWNFVESGEGSGIFKSTDGGNSWSRLNTKGSGFPDGAAVGRIGLSTVRKGKQTLVYAIVDNQAPRPKKEEDLAEAALRKQDFKKMTVEAFEALDEEELDAFLEDNRFPKKYNAAKLKRMVRHGKVQPSAIYDYLYNANDDLFDTEITGAEVYVSGNGGKSWNRTHEEYLDGLYNTYGYYFGKVHTNPARPEQLYIYGVPVLVSEDGGKNFHSINRENVHVDHHALWINPKRDGHLILGNDGGLNITYDNGEHWIKCNTPSVGQFYYVAVDEEDNYNVYGGTQDNGVWYGAHNNKPNVRWHGTGNYPFKSLVGGDGMQVAIDTRTNDLVYAGSQFGNYFRINKKTGARKRITPQHELGERPLRWNWQTPIHLSVHNQDILYMGAHRLYRSMNRGDDWQAISEDLTKGEHDGDVPFGTLTTIHESPLRFGLLYTGSDDGRVHHSPDGGHTWNDITSGLPKNLYISRVQASAHVTERVYVSLNGYRSDFFDALVFVSDNYGKDWKRIGTNLPAEPVNVIKEDPTNENILYVGTDHGVYVSLDGGAAFMAMNNGLPSAPVHDLTVQPKAKDLLVATHGRSFFIANVAHVQQLTDSVLASSFYVFDVDKISKLGSWGRERGAFSDKFNEPKISAAVYTSNPGTIKFAVKLEDLVLFSKTSEIPKGLSYITYNGTIDKKTKESFESRINTTDNKRKTPFKAKKADSGNFYLEKGTYSLAFEKDGMTIEKKLVIE